MEKEYIELIKKLLTRCPDRLMDYPDDYWCVWYYDGEKVYSIGVQDNDIFFNFPVKDDFSTEQIHIVSDRDAQEIKWKIQDWQPAYKSRNFIKFKEFVDRITEIEDGFDELVDDPKTSTDE